MYAKSKYQPKSIAYKYCEGQMKRTLKRELKAFELAGKEGNVIIFSSSRLSKGSTIVVITQACVFHCNCIISLE